MRHPHSLSSRRSILPLASHFDRRCSCSPASPYPLLDNKIGDAGAKLIADALDISVRTVEVHRARVFEKMDVRSAVELANLLREAGPGA